MNISIGSHTRLCILLGFPNPCKKTFLLPHLNSCSGFENPITCSDEFLKQNVMYVTAQGGS